MQAIDHLVRVELPQGPCWYRYSDDGYGEHPDGRPFDGTGIGRPWPLLIGERAHVELAAGRMDEACRLQRVFRDCANASGLLPEQSWDADNIPDRELVRGRPAGSAMPLVWAHAEYVKLLRSLSDNHVFDMPPQTVKRYLESESATSLRSWRFNHKCRELPVGKTLRIELPAPAQLHWSSDGWQTFCETPTTDSHLGIHFADLKTDQLSVGSAIDFTMRWLPSNEWEGFDFRIKVTP
jgi:glucoamylase